MHIPSIQEFLILCIFFELFLGAIFVIPLPKGWKNKLLNFIQTNQTTSQILTYHKVLIFVIFLLWATSIKLSYDLSAQHNAELSTHFKASTAKDFQILNEMFSAQRDVYLYGTFLFISIALNRFIVLLQQYYKVKISKEKEYNVDFTLPIEKILDKKNK